MLYDFHSGMSRVTYTQMVEWRHVIRRLSDFLRLVECHLAEMLRRIVYRAMLDFMKFVTESSLAEEPDEIAVCISTYGI